MADSFAGATDMFSGLILSFVTLALIYFWRRASISGAPRQNESGNLACFISKTIVWFLLIISAAFILLLVLAYFTGGEDISVLVLIGGMMFFFVFLLTIPALLSRFDIIYSDQGLAGPRQRIMLGLGFKRVEMVWSDIVRNGTTFDGSWYIENSDNDRIYWNYFYVGYPHFMESILNKCPSLKPDNWRGFHNNR